jgi:hypothetical protein
MEIAIFNQNVDDQLECIRRVSRMTLIKHTDTTVNNSSVISGWSVFVMVNQIAMTNVGCL